MNDLASRLRSAIQERRRLAEQATSGEWIHEYSKPTGQCVLPADAQSTLEFVARTQLAAAYFDAAHIAANSPAVVLRQVERDEAVLERHWRELRLQLPGGETFACGYCRWPTPWPCIDVRELAASYDLPTDARPHDPRNAQKPQKGP